MLQRSTPQVLLGGLAALALGLWAVCLAGVAAAEEPSSSGVSPTPQTQSKIDALIAEILEPEAVMSLDVRKSKLIRTKVPVIRISITHPKILDVVQYGPKEFELEGLQAGQTSLTLWFGDNTALRYQITVASGRGKEPGEGPEYGKLQKKINELFPNSMVQLIPFADKLIVRGQAKDSAEAAQILAVLSGQAINQRGGQLGPGSQAGGAAGVPSGNGEATLATIGGSPIGGEAAAESLYDLGTAVNPRPGSGLPAHRLISLLNVPGEQQVMLKVRVAELSRTAARQMKATLNIETGNVNLNTATGLSATFSSVLSPEDLSLAISAVSTSGYSKVLAEPNLVTLNGQPASFLAGGEFPVPTAVGIGGVSGINTQFRSFGAQLTFTPTIIDKDRIRLAVAPSVSSLNQANSVNNIPGLNTRSVTTTVDLRVGQWLAIAGLLSTEQNGTKTRVPFVGDIPVVGALFGSASTQNNETELLVLVSPQLVHPLDAQETPLLLPGMEVAEPNDAAFFLGGAYVAKWRGEICRPQGCQPPRGGQPLPRVAGPDIMSRPEYQSSEKYYVYGQHGLSH